MPNLERKKIEVGCGSTEICSTEMEIAELEAIFNRFKVDSGATHIYFGESTDRCGDHESYYIEFSKYRDETDDEYNKRIEEETYREQVKEREQKERDYKNLKTEIERMEKELTSVPVQVQAWKKIEVDYPAKIAEAKKRLAELVK
jgi:hypothetical protein